MKGTIQIVVDERGQCKVAARDFDELTVAMILCQVAAQHIALGIQKQSLIINPGRPRPTEEPRQDAAVGGLGPKYPITFQLRRPTTMPGGDVVIPLFFAPISLSDTDVLEVLAENVCVLQIQGDIVRKALDGFPGRAS